ncbi:MAG TPA: phosphoribosyl-AMP cyclohydrolase [bacterium]|nr:phosphoribosyl-AMP cyclohydrolase [bacterium]
MGLAQELKYKDGGLIPAIVQDEQGKILMVAYMNEEAVTYTEETKRATFWSRSRSKLWKKGEESGNFLEVLAIRADCDEDCLVLTCKPHGPACHTGFYTCFYRRWENGAWVTEGQPLKDPKEMYKK